MKRLLTGLLMAALAVSLGCGKGGDGPPGVDTTPAPPGAGETPLGTLKAFYHYRDRRNLEGMQTVAVDGIVPRPYQSQRPRLSRKQIEMREIVVDHDWVRDATATLYYRTWNSEQSKKKGGWVRIAKFVKRDGQWRISLNDSLRETMTQTKGKSPAGFWDGTKRWWKD